MSTKVLSRFLFWLIPVAVVILWILYLTMPDTFSWFSPSYAVLILAGAWGLIFLFKGIFEKNISPLKNFNILLAIGFLIVAFLFGALEIFNVPTEVIAPIVILLIILIPLFSVISNKGKKWDTADNKKVGYKNYYERKKEEKKENK